MVSEHSCWLLCTSIRYPQSSSSKSFLYQRSCPFAATSCSHLSVYKKRRWWKCRFSSITTPIRGASAHVVMSIRNHIFSHPWLWQNNARKKSELQAHWSVDEQWKGILHMPAWHKNHHAIFVQRSSSTGLKVLCKGGQYCCPYLTEISKLRHRVACLEGW